MQNLQGKAPPTEATELRDNIRDAIQQSVEAARTQAREATEAARQAAQAAGQEAPTAPVPPVGTPTVVVRGADFEVIPPQAVDMAVAFFVTVVAIVVLLPIARAFGRRIDRRSEAPRIPADVAVQLTQLNQSIEAIALEVERISEGQRFTTRLLTSAQEKQGSLLPDRT